MRLINIFLQKLCGFSGLTKFRGRARFTGIDNSLISQKEESRMASNPGFFGDFFTKGIAILQGNPNLLMIPLALSVIALLVSVYGKLMHMRRLKKLRKALEVDKEYMRLLRQTQENLRAMEKEGIPSQMVQALMIF
jgi:hypothetical protein